jgi:hypothetical protein
VQHTILTRRNAEDFLEYPHHMGLIGKAAVRRRRSRLHASAQETGRLVGSCLDAPAVRRNAESPLKLADEREDREANFFGDFSNLSALCNALRENLFCHDDPFVRRINVRDDWTKDFYLRVEVLDEGAHVPTRGVQGFCAVMQVQEHGAEGADWMHGIQEMHSRTFVDGYVGCRCDLGDGKVKASHLPAVQCGRPRPMNLICSDYCELAGPDDVSAGSDSDFHRSVGYNQYGRRFMSVRYELVMVTGTKEDHIRGVWSAPAGTRRTRLSHLAVFIDGPIKTSARFFPKMRLFISVFGILYGIAGPLPAICGRWSGR